MAAAGRRRMTEAVRRLSRQTRFHPSSTRQFPRELSHKPKTPFERSAAASCEESLRVHLPDPQL